jgi:hypothetical protein
MKSKHYKAQTSVFHSKESIEKQVMLARTKLYVVYYLQQLEYSMHESIN